MRGSVAIAILVSGCGARSMLVDDTDAGCGPDAGPAFAVERVDAIGTGGQMGNLAVDGDGVAHVVYVASGVGEAELRHAARRDGTWEIEVVDCADTSTRCGSPWLALGARGEPHVSYFRSRAGGGTDLVHARADSGPWASETVAPADGGTTARLAVGADGSVHIAYAVPPGSAGALRYATDRGGRFATADLDTTPNAGWSLAIAIGSDDVVRILHALQDPGGALQGDLVLLADSGGGWDRETMPRVGDGGYGFPSLAQGGGGASYSASSSQHVVLGRPEAGGWRVDVLDADGDAAGYASTVALQGGEPVVAYDWFERGSGYEVRLASGGAIETVASPSTLEQVSMALAPDASPRIAFETTSPPEVRYLEPSADSGCR